MKTLRECKNEIARKQSLGDTLNRSHHPFFHDEAAELYAQQYKNKIEQLEITVSRLEGEYEELRRLRGDNQRLKEENEAAEKVIKSYRDDQPEWSHLNIHNYRKWEREHQELVDAYESLKNKT